MKFASNILMTLAVALSSVTGHIPDHVAAQITPAPVATPNETITYEFLSETCFTTLWLPIKQKDVGPTSTVYKTTVRKDQTIDCAGCELQVKDWDADHGPKRIVTKFVTHEKTTMTELVCFSATT